MAYLTKVEGALLCFCDATSLCLLLTGLQSTPGKHHSEIKRGAMRGSEIPRAGTVTRVIRNAPAV